MKPDFAVVWFCPAWPPFDLVLLLCWGSDLVFALQLTGWESFALDCSLATDGAWSSRWILARAPLALIASTLRDDLWSRALCFCWSTSCRPLLGPHWNSRSVTECREGKIFVIQAHFLTEWFEMLYICWSIAPFCYRLKIISKYIQCVTWDFTWMCLVVLSVIR